MSEEPDLLVEKLRAMASNSEAFSKQEFGVVLTVAADRIEHDAVMIERVRSEIHLAVKSIDNARARAVLAKAEAKGRMTYQPGHERWRKCADALLENPADVRQVRVLCVQANRLASPAKLWTCRDHAELIDSCADQSPAMAGPMERKDGDVQVLLDGLDRLRQQGLRRERGLARPVGIVLHRARLRLPSGGEVVRLSVAVLVSPQSDHATLFLG